MDNARLEAIVRPVVEDLGFELWGCLYIPQGRSSVLRIYIDNPKGITAGDCQRVSKQVDAVLNVEEPMHGRYFLEVSSPGINRQLFTKKQFERYIGHTIKINLNQAVDGQKNFKAILKSVSEEELVIELDGELKHLPFVLLKKAKLIEI